MSCLSSLCGLFKGVKVTKLQWQLHLCKAETAPGSLIDAGALNNDTLCPLTGRNPWKLFKSERFLSRNNWEMFLIYMVRWKCFPEAVNWYNCGQHQQTDPWRIAVISVWNMWIMFSSPRLDISSHHPARCLLLNNVYSSMHCTAGYAEAPPLCWMDE